MIRISINLSRSASTLRRAVRLGSTSPLFTFHQTTSSTTSSPPFRTIHDGITSPNANPVTLQMINYALSHARSQKSDESYAQGMLVLEQCLSTLPTEDDFAQNSRGIVLLAMSNLLYERGSFSDAIEQLQTVLGLTQSSMGVKVAAMEALVGLHLQLGQDDTSSVLADKCLEMLRNDEAESTIGSFNAFCARAKALKGLVELVHGKTESAESFFQGLGDHESCTGNVALSYGEFLHATQNFSLAKEVYQKIVQRGEESENFNEINDLAVCNMSSEEVKLAATFALGQLESCMGNFGEAEETLTKALTKTEEIFGHSHSKVGVVLTAIALMFRHKARQEHSSSLLIQEGLYRRAAEFLKAPSLETEAADPNVDKRDVVALARGGYAELLLVQQNRKNEGEKMKMWAETTWGNRRISLAEALHFDKPTTKYPVIDARIGRVL